MRGAYDSRVEASVPSRGVEPCLLFRLSVAGNQALIWLNFVLDRQVGDLSRQALKDKMLGRCCRAMDSHVDATRGINLPSVLHHVGKAVSPVNGVVRCTSNDPAALSQSKLLHASTHDTSSSRNPS